MNADSIWKIINVQLYTQPIEILTVPSNSRVSLWFKAYKERGEIYVDNAENHSPPTNMSQRRKITEKDFKTVFSYFPRWAAGDRYLRQEVRLLSRNTAYIFALITYFQDKINKGDSVNV